MQSGQPAAWSAALVAVHAPAATGAFPPEQIAQIVTAKLKSPVGQPDKAELSLKVVLPRRARAVQRAGDSEGRNLAAVVAETLGGAAR